MSVECPADIFKQFEDGCGSYVCPMGEGFSFLHDAFYEAEWIGVIWLDIRDLDNKSFNDWKQFEYWCDNTKLGLMWDLVDKELFYDISESSSPKDYFKSKTAVKEQIISLLCNTNTSDIESLKCAEIESKNKKLFLIYDDMDGGWALGHNDRVLVFDSLDLLTPQNGFYPQT